MRFRCIDWRGGIQRRRERLLKKHKWFSWKPVKLDNGECCWLETIYREGYEVTYQSEYGSVLGIRWNYYVSP